jgi:hypothetical protein
MQRRAAGWVLISAFLFALALAVAPQLHERLHTDSSAAGHNCAATLISSGNCDHACAALPACELQVLQVATVTVSHVTAVAAPLTFTLLEHAPPAFS